MVIHFKILNIMWTWVQTANIKQPPLSCPQPNILPEGLFAANLQVRDGQKTSTVGFWFGLFGSHVDFACYLSITLVGVSIVAQRPTRVEHTRPGRVSDWWFPPASGKTMLDLSSI